MAVVGGVVAALLLGFLVTRSPLLDVDRIDVRGATRTPADQLLQVMGLRRREAMLDVDSGRAEAAAARLPWVERVTVARQWPGTVTVEVVERTPLAAMATPAGAAVVDRAGRVLEVTATPPPGLVTLAGLDPAGAPGSTLGDGAAELLTVAAALPADLLPLVSAVERSDGGVSLVLAAGGRVLLGPADDLGAKLLAATTVLRQVELTEVCTIDVRVPGAASLTRARPCA